MSHVKGKILITEADIINFVRFLFLLHHKSISCKIPLLWIVKVMIL